MAGSPDPAILSTCASRTPEAAPKDRAPARYSVNTVSVELVAFGQSQYRERRAGVRKEVPAVLEE